MASIPKARSQARGSLRHRQGGWWAAAASVVGDIISSQGQSSANSANSAEAARNRSFQAQQAQVDRDFQERMSDTAVERRSDDMKKAGINPILAAGNPASQPSGAQAAGSQSAPMQNSAASFGNLGAQLQQAQVNSAQVGNVKADTQNKIATTANIDADTNLKKVMKDQSTTQAELNRTTSASREADIAVANQTVDNMAKQAQLIDKQTTSAQQGIDQANKINSLLVQAQSTANILAKLNVPGAQAAADSARTLGALGSTPTGTAVKNLVMLLQTILHGMPKLTTGDK